MKVRWSVVRNPIHNPETTSQACQGRQGTAAGPTETEGSQLYLGDSPPQRAGGRLLTQPAIAARSERSFRSSDKLVVAPSSFVLFPPAKALPLLGSCAQQPNCLITAGKGHLLVASPAPGIEHGHRESLAHTPPPVRIPCPHIPDPLRSDPGHRLPARRRRSNRQR